MKSAETESAVPRHSSDIATGTSHLPYSHFLFYLNCACVHVRASVCTHACVSKQFYYLRRFLYLSPQLRCYREIHRVRIERQDTEFKKIFANHINNKELVSKMEENNLEVQK